MAKQDQNPKTPSTPQEDLAAELLLKDADEAMRQERLNHIWQEWGSTIIGCALMIIFGTMLGVGWQNWRKSVHEGQTVALLSPVKASQQDLSGAHAGLSHLIMAGSIADKASAGDELSKGMMVQWADKAADAGLPRQWDVLAQWSSLRVQADQNHTDKMDIAKDMKKLARKKGHPYTPVILMEAGVLMADNKDVEGGLALLYEAQGHEATADMAQLQKQIHDLIHFYEAQHN